MVQSAPEMRSIAALACFAIIVSGCDTITGQCSAGEERCDGDVRWICTEACDGDDCETDWKGWGCVADRVCAQAGDRTVCALSPERDPLCVSQSDYATYCSDGVITQCEYGYPIGRTDCAQTGQMCRDDLDACVFSTTPDPRCDTHDSCDGDERVQCIGAYAEQVETCEAGCAELTGFGASCVVPSSEGLCPPPAEPSDDASGCVGDVWYHCFEGVAYELLDCTHYDQVCGEDPGNGAGCIDPPAP